MPEQLKITNHNTTTEWAVLASLANANKEVMQRIIDRKEGDTIEVCLTINGEETSFSTIINRLKEEAQQWAWDRAREIYEERVGELGERLRKLAGLADKLEADFKCEVSKILPESLTDEDYR